MCISPSATLATVCLLPIFPLLTTATPSCPPSGPLLPRPRSLSTSPFLQGAFTNLTNTLNTALAEEIGAGWHIPNTSFSLAFITHDDPSPNHPTWEFHHRGSANPRGVAAVDGESQYLIGSTSKLLSDVLVEKAGVDAKRRMTEWVPELAKGESKIRWEEITFGELRQHLAGIPPNSGFSEYYYLLEFFERLGFPHLTPADFPECGIIGLNGDCTREQTLQRVLDLYPVAPVNQRVVYSQLSFTLISYAMNASLGKNYSELLEEYVTKPLAMTSTRPSPGDDSKAVIPPVENSWGSDYGDNAPGGGLVSTTNDLARLVHSILNYAIFDTEAAVKRWLKPTSETTSPTTSVGRPWEIIRSPTVIPRQMTDIYSKSGGAYGYGSHLSIVDQYGVGFVVLKAGPPTVEYIMIDTLLSTILPAVEEETRLQAQKYAGAFASPANTTAVQANFTIDEGPGLRLGGLTRNGSDIVAGIEGIWPYTALGVGGNLSTDNLRLYPAGIYEKSTYTPAGSNKSIPVIFEDWRLNFDAVPNEGVKSDLPSSGVMNDFCVSWQMIDWVYYGGEPIDRFVYVLDEKTNELVGLEIPFLRASLTKTESI